MFLPDRIMRPSNFFVPVSLVLLAVGLAGYLAQLQRLNQVMDQWDATGEQIAVIETSFGQDRKQFMAGIRSLQERYYQILERLPSKDQQGIRLISDAARVFELEVAAIRSEGKAIFLDDKKLPVQLEGKNVQISNISLELKGTYGNLVRYLSALGDLPAYVTVERLEIVSSPAGSGNLMISLGLSLYLLL